MADPITPAPNAPKPAPSQGSATSPNVQPHATPPGPVRRVTITNVEPTPEQAKPEEPQLSAATRAEMAAGAEALQRVAPKRV